MRENMDVKLSLFLQAEAMVSQIKTARCESFNNDFCELQTNGKPLAALNIHRLGLARAYIIGKGTEVQLMAKLSARMQGKFNNVKLDEITERVSQLKITSNDYWKPSLCTTPKRNVSFENVTRVVAESRSDSRAAELDSRESDNASPVLIDKLDHHKPTAEMELVAKTDIESNPDFKLLFIPGYEVEEPDACFEDPIPEYLGAGFESEEGLTNVPDDLFLQRLLVLGRLHKETVCTEERQQRFENLLKTPRYSLVPKIKLNERKQTNINDEQTRTRTQKHDKIRTRTTKNSRSDGIKTGSKNSKDKKRDTERISDRWIDHENSYLDESCDDLKPDALQALDRLSGDKAGDKTLKSKGGRKKYKNTNGELKPTRFYDITEVAAIHSIPCAEKLSIDGRRSRRNSLLPGKSFFSQRSNSLTRINNVRPATAVKKKKTAHKTNRPKTAVPDKRSKVKAVRDS